MKYSLKTRDFLKGLLMAVLAGAFMVVQKSIDEGRLEFNWKNIGMAAVAAAGAYLSKNYFTDEVKQAHKTIEESRKQK